MSHASDLEVKPRRRSLPRMRLPDARWPVTRLFFQFLIVIAVLAAWQWVPTIGWVTDQVRWTDRFFISSPTEIAKELRNLATGTDTQGVTFWPYLKQTLIASVLGSSIGLVVGALVGLIFSNNPKLADIMQPFVVLMNSIPRIALIPIFILVAGPTMRAEILSVIFVVFFLVFFNAFEGGRSVSPAMLENATLLGANGFDLMRTIRWPVVLHWTFASVPNAISFGLIVAVTTEVLAGLPGMGSLLLAAMQSLDASYTFAIIVVLAIVGVVMAGIGRKLRDLLIRW